MIGVETIDPARSKRIEKLAHDRGLKLRRQGRELVGPCRRCGGHDRFSINVNKQVWNCRGCGTGGDVIALVMHVDGCDFPSAVATLAGVPVSNEAGHAETRSGNDDDEAERHRAALWLWGHRRPIAGSPAEVYLRSVRRIHAPLPPTLGYLPPWREHPPALIAAFGRARELEPGVLTIADGAVRGVHVIRLKPDGSGKTEIETETSHGLPKGAPIMLAAPNDLLGLVIAEGIEDALTAHQATGLGAWASGGASSLPALAVPSYIEVVTIVVDDNAAGRDGAARLAERLDARGIEVVLDGRLP
jgi:hypothetical protein